MMFLDLVIVSLSKGASFLSWDCFGPETAESRTALPSGSGGYENPIAKSEQAGVSGV